jgi:hypothetical protein
MLATFCLRLALGMLAALLLLSPKQMHPRFFRTHFLTVLGLNLVALYSGWSESTGPAALFACVFSFLGAVVWIFERTLLGWALLALTGTAIIAALALANAPQAVPLIPLAGSIADDLSAATLLGFAMTAMLVGHSYLISPGLTIRPLVHQLAALGVSLLLRLAVAGTALWFWTSEHDLTNVNDETVLWLPVRWLIGLVGPLGFGWLAFQTARIRSTQSATGILYVVVILVFLGELMSLLLMRNTGLPL